jgi:hypothetical protein
MGIVPAVYPLAAVFDKQNLAEEETVTAPATDALPWY